MLGALLAPCAQATVFQVVIDTTGWAGGSATLAFSAFDLSNGDLAADNSVTVSNFYNGVDALPGFTLAETDASVGLNEVLQSITLGQVIRFTLTLTEQYTDLLGGLWDQFALFLLDDSAGSSVVTTDDPLGTNALFAVDIDGSPTGQLSRFAPTGGEGITWTVTPAAPMPLPATPWLLGAGALGGWLTRRRRPGTR